MMVNRQSSKFLGTFPECSLPPGARFAPLPNHGCRLFVHGEASDCLRP
jgi:hypothetical protein